MIEILLDDDKLILCPVKSGFYPGKKATLGWFGDRSGARSMLRLPEPALLGVL